jgi:hypothetical protein
MLSVAKVSEFASLIGYSDAFAIFLLDMKSQKIFGKGLVNRFLIFFPKKIKNLFTKPPSKPIVSATTARGPTSPKAKFPKLDLS